MYYHTPNTSGFVAAVRRFRSLIIGFFIVISIAIFAFIRPELISSDTFFWLSESKQFQKTCKQEYTATYIGRLSVRTDSFDEQTKIRLQLVQNELEHLSGVEQVESLFASYIVYNDQSFEESALVKALSINRLDAEKIHTFVTAFPKPYEQMVNDDFTEFHFLIHSKTPIAIDSITVPFKFHYSEPVVEAELGHYLWYAGVIIIVILLMSQILFKNFIAAIGAISVTLITLIWTFCIIYLLTGSRQMHIAMSLMVVSIAIGHYLYFYYRWHVSQFKNDPIRALEKSINRNLHPAVWTLPVLIISLGSLLFADSKIVTMLSMSLMVSSAVAYIVNIVFLPALLSYFSVSHPKVGFARICYWFANREIHYNPKILKGFMTLSFIVLIVMAIRVTTASDGFFDKHVTHTTITLNVPFEEIDLNTLQKIETFEKELRADNHGIAKVDSIVTILKQLDMANKPQSVLDEQRLLQALFFLELYDLKQAYIEKDALNITITLHNADQSSIIRWLEGYQKLPLYFTDVESLSESSKMDKSILLAFSLVSALLMIGLIMGVIFRSIQIGVVGFVANALPIIWFTLFMMLFDFALSIEALIAMTISVGLTSDTIIHFAYKYFRSRYFGRTRKHALEIMFFYSGVPAITSAVVLMIVFALLTLTQLQSLQLIGAYGTLLMFMSLLSDLFILPVLLLSIDRSEQKN
ncbi:MAG: hypothetical protein M0P91_14570 [Sulfuricurvum sp.]|jgi:hypothetical protein|uniref:hypothetical protein n=1 Tax=Sulfuricurvum sp. TaxID=2025608 RepID=UPI0025FCC92C|nr:hypothetical protein [Sulfuricurvum sp.]MCK9374402.1 hypothetical protein [Sulfuricurvum sp.]